MVRVGEAPGLESDAEYLLEKCGALLYGNFVLASGRETNFYFDSKQLTMDPEGAAFVAKHFFEKVEKEDIEIVGGAPYSAVPIASYICLFSSLMGSPRPSFFIRKQSKGHGLEKLLEGKQVKGHSRICVVDDVVTTGDSLLDAISTVEREGHCKVEWALALVDRNELGRETIESQGYKFWSLFTVIRSPDGEVRFRLNEP